MAPFMTNNPAFATAEISAPGVVVLAQPTTIANGYNHALAARCTR